MKTCTPQLRQTSISSRDSKFRFASLGMLAVIASLSACGGGGGTDASSGADTASSTSTTTGTVSGLGSIVVSGVRYSTDNASITYAEDGSNVSQAITLGKTVTVTGTADSSTGAGVAQTIQVYRGIQGSAGNANCTASGNTTGAFTLNGQRVNVNEQTIWSGASDTTYSSSKKLSCANLPTSGTGSTYLEVSGDLNADGSMTATRVEQISSVPTTFSIRGTIGNLNASAQTFQLTLGSGVTATVNYSGAAIYPANAQLTGSSDVRVQLTGAEAQKLINASATQTGSSSQSVSVSAQRVAIKSYQTNDRRDSQVRLYGAVSNQTASTISVQGVTLTRTAQTSINGTTVASFPSDGTYVEITARSNGTSGDLELVSVTASGQQGASRSFEVYGTASCSYTSSLNLSSNGSLTLMMQNGSTTSVDTSQAQIQQSVQINANSSGTCFLEVTGTVNGSTRTFQATSVKVKSFTASGSVNAALG